MKMMSYVRDFPPAQVAEYVPKMFDLIMTTMQQHPFQALERRSPLNVLEIPADKGHCEPVIHGCHSAPAHSLLAQALPMSKLRGVAWGCHGTQKGGWCKGGGYGCSPMVHLIARYTLFGEYS